MRILKCRQLGHRHWMGALLFLVGVGGVPLTLFAQPPQPQVVATTGDPKAQVERERLDFEKQKEAARLAFDTRKHALDHELESKKLELEGKKFEWTFWSLWIPVVAVLVGYFFQRRMQRTQDLTQFQLKAAEIIMAARDTSHVRRKAELLTTLFPGQLGGLEDALKGRSFPIFGRSVESREDLLKLLMEFPEARADIIQAWGILFPWDNDWAGRSEAERNAYRWFDELKKDATLNKNKPAAVSRQP